MKHEACRSLQAAIDSIVAAPDEEFMVLPINCVPMDDQICWLLYDAAPAGADPTRDAVWVGTFEVIGEQRWGTRKLTEEEVRDLPQWQWPPGTMPVAKPRGQVERERTPVSLPMATVQLVKEELFQFIADIGGCDHSVGMCCCGLRSLIADLDEAMKEAE